PSTTSLSSNESAIRKTIPPRLITGGQFLLEEPSADETVCDALIIILLHRLQHHLKADDFIDWVKMTRYSQRRDCLLHRGAHVTARPSHRRSEASHEGPRPTPDGRDSDDQGRRDEQGNGNQEGSRRCRNEPCNDD